MPTGWSCTGDTTQSPPAKQNGGKRVGYCLLILSQTQACWPELCMVPSPLFFQPLQAVHGLFSAALGQLLA